MKNEEWRVVQRTRGSTLKQLWARLRSGFWVPTERFMCDAQMMPPIMGGSPGVVNRQIAASADDADQTGGGVPVVNGLLIRIRQHAVDPYHGGFRWLNITVPNAATINTATMQLHRDDATVDDDLNTTIYGNDVDDANDFTVEQDITGRALTAASVAWVDSGSGNVWITSPEIKTIIQEIVNRGLWASGNDMAMLLICGAGGDRYAAEAWDDVVANSAKISIDFTAVGVGVEIFRRRIENY